MELRTPIQGYWSLDSSLGGYVFEFLQMEEAIRLSNVCRGLTFDFIKCPVVCHVKWSQINKFYKQHVVSKSFVNKLYEECILNKLKCLKLFEVDEVLSGIFSEAVSSIDSIEKIKFSHEHWMQQSLQLKNDIGRWCTNGLREFIFNPSMLDLTMNDRLVSDFLKIFLVNVNKLGFTVSGYLSCCGLNKFMKMFQSELVSVDEVSMQVMDQGLTGIGLFAVLFPAVRVFNFKLTGKIISNDIANFYKFVQLNLRLKSLYNIFIQIQVVLIDDEFVNVVNNVIEWGEQTNICGCVEITLCDNSIDLQQFADSLLVSGLIDFDTKQINFCF